MRTESYAALLLTMISALPVAGLSAQSLCTDGTLREQIEASAFIHSPLPLDSLHSLDRRQAEKTVLRKEPLPLAEPVEISFVHKEVRPHGPADDPDYATFGSYSTSIRLDRRNLEEYDRIEFLVYPDCEGYNVVNLDLSLHNAYTSPKEGYTVADASHLVNLKNRRWNRCYLEIAEWRRNAVESISFSFTDRGGVPDGAKGRFLIDSICFQKVESPEKTVGWVPDRIAYSHTGYFTDGKKTAVCSPALKGGFSIREAGTGKKVFSGRIRKVRTATGEYGLMDFSAVRRPGSYTIEAGGIRSEAFRIGDDIFVDSRWKVLNFIFCQRCGDAVPGIHERCHEDVYAEHGGVRISYGGGWHDAGDLSQQTLQTGEVAMSLLEASRSAESSNPVLSDRLRQEARHGLDFILKCRFGDGFRASSIGLIRWTDGREGTSDDIETVRVQNNSFDNFLLSGIEAYAATVLSGSDAEYAGRLARAAEEDFAFASEKFAREGYDSFSQMYEHTYNTSASQYHATLSWAASRLYRLTGKRAYAERAAEEIRYTLSCQETVPIAGGLAGWFYRDSTKRSIVHFIHQSRDQVFAQALVLLCKTQPSSPERDRWEAALRLYGDYLKKLMHYTEPYGMVPSGVYMDSETEDSEGFRALHIMAPGNAEQLYAEHLKAGVRIGPDHVVRCFPPFLSIFNGNTAVHLSTGKAAALCGKYFGDGELTEIAREQLYWTVGKNPFCQSLIYGEGHDYPSMDSFSSGEITGEMPVGIRTYGQSDTPYWPQTNAACYKEVWLTSAGKWLSLLSEL